jgi:hypothetical protein
MIAWNGCEKIMCNSKTIVTVEQQTQDYLDSLQPMAVCEFGDCIADHVKKENIKIKF